AVSLLAAVVGGLRRAGVVWPAPSGGVAIGQAAAAHAALMMCGFLGTVIAIERAVAIKLRSALVAPAVSGLAGALMLGGHAEIAAWLWVFAGLVFVGVNVVVVLRQAAAHTVLLLVGALAWLTGNLVFAVGLEGSAVLPWWFAFLVLTVAAERLEMTRLMRRHPVAQPSLHATLLVMIVAAALSAADPAVGGLAYGAALVALAAWLGTFDIARRTALAHGLSRYMAVCLLCGYVWLGIAGLAWGAMSLGLPTRDLALHALGLGFIFSMIMGHAPVILPAVARVKLLIGPWFYAPLALLHGSLALRLLGGLASAELRSIGASLNAFALALFVLTVAGSALAWRLREVAMRTNIPPPR
ncbi:hypothetical protein, partial [Piscinibacter sp.]|uniref:hypothetical protein n=1 Tax=Piscinibacter sp. TaxID=1903157 RepID=UPI002C76B678